MGTHVFRPGSIGWEGHLIGLSSLIAVVSLAFVWSNPNPETSSIPEVVIPLCISLGLGLYTLRLRRRESPFDRFEPMVKYGWAGALLSSAIGGFWLALHLYYGLPIDVLPDKILTILSVGIAAGVLAGRSSSLLGSHSPAPDGDWDRDRDRVLAETTWTTRSGSTPIAHAIIDALAEAAEIDPVELDPLYTYVDPELLVDMRSHDGAPWQFTVYTAEYEIRVSSHGTVTVYRNDRSTR